MRLTIIPIDKAVYINGVSYANLTWEGTPSNLHALQWFDDNQGWLEFKDGSPNELISVLPEWTTSALAAWQHADSPPPPPAPTPEELKISNAETAVQLLKDSDFTQLTDVNLLNKDEWSVYRQAIRDIATNPPAEYIVFPTVPNLVWN